MLTNPKLFDVVYKCSYLSKSIGRTPKEYILYKGYIAKYDPKHPFINLRIKWENEIDVLDISSKLCRLSAYRANAAFLFSNKLEAINYARNTLIKQFIEVENEKCRLDNEIRARFEQFETFTKENE